jgi:H+/Cl- antiporter ClcA
MPWWWYIAFLAVLAAFVSEILCLIRCIKSHNKTLLRWQSIITLAYVLVIITAILWLGGNKYYFIRAGIATSISITMLALLHIADIIANRQS